MEDPYYDKPLLVAEEGGLNQPRSESSNPSPLAPPRFKPWHVIVPSLVLLYLMGFLVVAFVAWPRGPPMQVADFSFRAANLKSVGGALLLDVDLGLELEKANAQQLPNRNVKATLTCSFIVNPANSMILSRECDAKRQTSNLPDHETQHPPLLKGSTASKVFTSWYMIVLYVLLGILIIATVVWILYPKIPEVTLERLQLDGLSTDARMPSKDSYLPKLNLDLKLMIALKIRNPNFIGTSFDKITVYVNYYGYQLCKADLDGDEIPPRGDSTVESIVNVKCAQIMYNSAQLVTDVAMRELPMNVVVEFSGYVGRQWFRAPVKVAVSLDAKVDPVSTDILEQNYDLV